LIRSPITVAASAGTSGGVLDPKSSSLDSLSLQFVIWAQANPSVALDIGCGEGIATRAILARGGHVVAVDPDAEVLHRLIEHIPLEQCPRLTVRLGQLPQIDFKRANFGAIHAPRILQLLDLEDARLSLRKFYRWLYPAGKLFVSTPNPRGAQGRAGPGNPLDKAALGREVTAAGLVVEESFTYVPAGSGAQECCAVIARCPQ
jgi:2-polyprenyl-3-methyl-5-hydroxy-6-metoxy-1,4-benzoquinol methylase